MLALFENPILNDTAPVIGVKNGEWIAHISIGQVHGSLAFGHAILPPTDNDSIDGLSHIVARLRISDVLDLSIAIITGQGGDADQFGAQPFLRGFFAMPMTNDPLTHHHSLAKGSPCASWTTAMLLLPTITKSRPF
jgi:hypothetical protein